MKQTMKLADRAFRKIDRKNKRKIDKEDIEDYF